MQAYATLSQLIAEQLLVSEVIAVGEFLIAIISVILLILIFAAMLVDAYFASRIWRSTTNSDFRVRIKD